MEKHQLSTQTQKYLDNISQYWYNQRKGIDATMTIKPVLWISSSKRDLMNMPHDIITAFGYGLHEAQIGERPGIAKTLKGFRGASVIELRLDDKAGTYRAIYTVKFAEAIVVLHVFQKKSKKGIETPKQDIELINLRLKLAEKIYREWQQKEGGSNG